MIGSNEKAQVTKGWLIKKEKKKNPDWGEQTLRTSAGNKVIIINGKNRNQKPCCV